MTMVVAVMMTMLNVMVMTTTITAKGGTMMGDDNRVAAVAKCVDMDRLKDEEWN